MQFGTGSTTELTQKTRGSKYKNALRTSIHYWRASVASETLTGVTQLKIGDVCLFIYMFGRTQGIFLYFDPRVFVLVRWSTRPKLH